MSVSKVLVGLGLVVALAAVTTIPTVLVLGSRQAQANSNCKQYHEKAIQAATTAAGVGDSLQARQGAAQLSLAWSMIAANCAKQ